MKILIFLHGTLIMHKSAEGKTREQRVKQVKDGEHSVHDYVSYIPVGNAVEKLKSWKSQGAEILYLSSHKSAEDAEKDEIILEKYNFPEGQVLYRQNGESYKDIVEKIVPNILIEDDCESIGGEKEMTITFIEPEIRQKIKSIVVKEFTLVFVDDLEEEDMIYAIDPAGGVWSVAGLARKAQKDDPATVMRRLDRARFLGGKVLDCRPAEARPLWDDIVASTVVVRD